MPAAAPPSVWPVDPDRLISAFVAAWNETVAPRRHRHLRACWGDAAFFVDPLTQLQGLAALDGYIASVRAGEPAMRFELAGRPDHHHGRLRFSWRLVDGGGRLCLRGSSFGEIGADGRFQRLVAFFDGEREAPAAPAAAGALRPSSSR